MFEALTERLQKAFLTLRGHGHLTEAELSDGLREIRLALLEADVHLQVVKELIERVRVKASAEEILKSLTPGQQVVKALRDEMVAILAQGNEARLRQVPVPPTVVLMVGLQGSGKTTTTAKLARLLKSQGRSPLLVAADVRRPAAVEQLQVLGKQAGVPVAAAAPGAHPGAVCAEARARSRLR